ncbi:hypothetical protein [Xanthomonas arboricola]|uniref:ParB/Sulfiredoxin domain-containing protein n=1 Tax=Xanthomonas campestris pv. juglandis TaxID=195709 RepID=A0A7U7DEY4_XANCJ|nr:hypothetical protein [Xanthomonas arboricola]CAD1793816.1 hypothetical protein XSP_002717 [Xanthomonas arboricola pv. juglandis]CAD7348421.1 hypothetical protein X12_001694 [Xanthomonas arboricola]SUZ37788.1 hypothetical protein CPBF1521_37240 [Xanthomonas arboricola pv. juglandis]SYZ62017.1 hypothetical protein CPBF427_42220 [Xanthomonas arboricola pv. juglandis]
MSNVQFSSISLADIFLDNENPRHDPIDAEPDIIAKLVADEKVLNLASSIATHGTSPLERLAVVSHTTQKNKFIVVEGNRRLCALKLLMDPHRAPNAQTRRALEGYKASGIPVAIKIEVAIFPSRAAARYWLSLRHEGELDGVGTRTWKPGEKARFNAQGSPTSNPNTQALALLDYAEQSGIISSQQKKKIPLTTVTRYLSNPVVRSTFGLTNSRDLTIDVEQTAFDGVVGKFLEDAASGDANSRTNSAERKKYAQELQKAGIAPKERISAPVLAIPASTENKVKERRTTRHPGKRPYIIPSDFKLKTKDNILRRVYEELRKLDPDTYPFAGGYLLRAFVEKVAFEFAKQRGKGTNGQKLHQVIQTCCDELRADGATNRQLKPLSVMSTNVHSSTSPDTLGASVHLTLIPTGDSLRAQWEELEGGLQLMLDRMK